MNGRSVAFWAVIGIASFLYFGAPMGERKEYKSRMYAQETAALRNLQIVNTAQVQFNSQFGRYARSLTELGPSVSNLISADLAAGEKHGYKFTLTGTPTRYKLTAASSVLRSTGVRTFYSDQSLTIRESYGPEPATANSREVGSSAANPGETKQQ